MAAAGEEASGGGDKYRSFMYGEGEKDTVWRLGSPPNYDVVNKLFEEERTKEWPEGSLEEKVQRLLKTWEMELVHKVRPEDQKSVHSQKFCSSTNGMRFLNRKDLMAIGSYNAFLQTKLPPEHRIYDPDKETLESGMATFLTAFPRGFAIEVLDVYSGPPRIVDEEMKVEKAEFFYERGNFLASFLSAPAAAATEAASGSGCPVMGGN
uniref:Uncharacterized protein n=1 Tax=Oryza glumipatula TaxID=40148 RepID=A0A0D9Y618_9ORYZ